ncbi:hypothetical protein tinsulaeT_33010 [Thalassotalea insulae]|uniref:Outer-membrane lipoprotein LolB n=1 Tax=Thalassotalea insulae TaxID=2056778 RepID=A0ABQ6GVK2_9GAMM|nr:lipoprotein insertase outer membrane protein LolB [Thalassotalea insulae]GLX79961.1 hypothetical protein tinsulaeT_33010 [Thalassotalea insulae]
MSNIFRLWPFILLITITACSSLKQPSPLPVDMQLTKAQRQQQLNNISQWQVTGKLAFITPEKRESANLFWQLNQKQKSQQLTLTSYLGINVLSLSSNNDYHTVEVDGEQYQGNDLEQLIYQLTQLNLPTQAMQYWLKGLTWSEQDQISYDANTGLPTQLLSYYNGRHWQISFDNYQLYYQLPMARKITIRQGQLTIKLLINQWTF